MREIFRHYLRPTDDEFAHLWQNALFIFDASVLLNIYGYSQETRDELVSFLETNAERLQLPYQFGLEYTRDRCAVIMKQVRNYQDAERELKQIRERFFAPKREHPYLSEQCLKYYEEILEELSSRRAHMTELLRSDPFLERLLAAFEGRIGPAPTDVELKKLQEEAIERYGAKIPPGYADIKKKGEPQACGDYVGWRQIISIASEMRRDVILIIDDFKEDWWQIEAERVIGPKPELIAEFSLKTSQNLYLYTSENFLRFAQSSGVAQISASAIEEVGQHLASQRERDASHISDKPVSLDKLGARREDALKMEAPNSPEAEKSSAAEK